MRQQQKAVGGSSKELADSIKQAEASLGRASRLAKRYGVDLKNLAQSQRQLQRTARLQGLQQNGLKRLGQLKSAGKWAAGGLAGAAGGLFAMVKSTADRGDPIAKHADKLGFSVEGLQEYQYAAERSGVSAAQFNTAAQRMVRRVSEASVGLGKTGKALNELGLDAKWLNKLKPEQQFEQISEAMKQIPSKANRVRLAMKLFDTEGVGLVNMLKDGKKGLEDLRSDARSTGNIISEADARNAEEFQDAFLDFKQIMGGLSKSIGAKFMPLFTKLMVKFKAFHARHGVRINQVLQKISSGLMSVGQFVWNLGKAVVTVASKINSFIDTTVGWKNIAAVVGALIGVKLVGAVIAAGSALMAMIPIIIAVGVAMTANPIGLVIKGIAIGAALIYANWEPIAGFFSACWDRIKSIFKTSWEAIKYGFLNFTPLGLLISNWDQVKSYFSGMWDRVKNTFSAGWGGIKQSFANLSPKKLMKKAWQPAIDWLRSKFEWIGSAIKKIKGVKRWFTWGKDEDDNPAEAEQKKQEPRQLKPSVQLVTTKIKQQARPKIQQPERRLRLVATNVKAKSQQQRQKVQQVQATNGKQVESRLQRISQQKTINATTNLNAPITINAAPGMSAEEVVQQVRNELEEREQEAEARQRGALYDMDMASAL